ncbi:MAG: hypothetical protein IIC04_12355 [Proteobacteria bacterium]|nr:hypothetical protein [Pseudomonadota bacterium]
MTDESMWIDRANTAEAKLTTLQDQTSLLKEKVRSTREAVCAKEHSDGSFTIDFDALLKQLGAESCLELRASIDEEYRISGAAGEKPRIRVQAA